MEVLAVEDLSALERRFLADSRAEEEAFENAREFSRLEQLRQAQALAETERQRSELERQAKETANAATASVLITSAMTRLEKGETFAALHEIATAVIRVGDQNNQQSASRLRLGLLTQTVPQLAAILPHPTGVAATELSGDGNTLVTTDYNGTVRVFSLDGLADNKVSPPVVLGSFKHDPPFKARLSQDGRLLISMSPGNVLQIREFGSSELPFAVELPEFPLHGIALTTDGELLAAHCSEGPLAGSVGVWKTSSKSLIAEFPHNHRGMSWIDDIVFSEDGSMAATLIGGTTTVWDTRDGSQIVSFADDCQAFSIAFRPGHRQIISSTSDGINLRDLDSGQIIEKFQGFAALVNRAMFDRTGERLLGLSQGDNPRIWNFEGNRHSPAVVFHVRDRVPRHSMPRMPIDAVFVSDGSRVLTWGANNATLWDVLTGQPVWNIQGHIGGEMTGHIADASVSQDGTLVVTAGADKTVRIWRVPTSAEACISVLDPHTKQPLILLPPADNDEVDSSRAKKGSPETLNFIETMRDLHARGEPRIDDTSPDGSLLVTVDDSSMVVSIKNAETGKTISKLSGHENVIHGLRFHSSGRLIVTFSSGDGTARVWGRKPNGEFLLELLIVQEAIRGVTLNSSGSFLAVATSDNYVALWDLTEKKLIFRAMGNTGPVSSCAFDPNGRFVTAFSPDWEESSTRQVLIWDMTPLELQAEQLAAWVEWYTGTKWTPDMPGGVNGLTELEWLERQAVVINAREK